MTSDIDILLQISWYVFPNLIISKWASFVPEYDFSGLRTQSNHKAISSQNRDVEILSTLGGYIGNVSPHLQFLFHQWVKSPVLKSIARRTDRSCAARRKHHVAESAHSLRKLPLIYLHAVAKNCGPKSVFAVVLQGCNEVQVFSRSCLSAAVGDVQIWHIPRGFVVVCVSCALFLETTASKLRMMLWSGPGFELVSLVERKFVY